MKQLKRVLIYSKLEHTARRQAVLGIGRYVRERHGWQPLIPWMDMDSDHWSVPEGLEIDGVIAYPKTQEEFDFLLGLKKPVVCIGPFFADSGLPNVNWDDALAGYQAVEHLADSGLKRVGFVGADFKLPYLRDRLEGARRAASDLGLDFESVDLEPEGHCPGDERAAAQRSAQWLRAMEKPFGLVAATDFNGFNLLQVLPDLGIRVPDEAAVISIGGDNLLCPFCEPALSSIELPGREAGYRAAELLDRLIAQPRSSHDERILVAPRRLAARGSSDIVATQDEMVRQALRFIRDHVMEGIGVSDVLAAVPISRRPLELRFKRETGRTLQKEIWRVRLNRAKEMLSETDLPIAAISDRCGFTEPQRMTEVFQRELGCAPGAWRTSPEKN